MRHCQTFSRTVAGWLTLIVVTVGWNLVCPPLLADSPAPSFDPVEREVEGWQVDVDPALLSEPHAQVGVQALAALGNHLQRVKFIVPVERVKQLQQVRIWLELKHPQLDRMQYHPNRAWLVANGHDPRLAKHVHIPVAAQLFARNMWAQHPCKSGDRS